MGYETDKWEYLPAKYQKLGNHREIWFIVIHCMQANETDNRARACAKYFQNPPRPGSSHVCVDDTEVIQCVYDSNIAAGAVGANTHGLHIEQPGYAEQTREQWLDEYSKAALENAADVAAQWCLKYDIPIVFLSAEDLKANKKGITSHQQVSKAFPGTGHFDPGDNYPWEVFMTAVHASYDKRKPATESE